MHSKAIGLHLKRIMQCFYHICIIICVAQHSSLGVLLDLGLVTGNSTEVTVMLMNTLCDVVHYHDGCSHDGSSHSSIGTLKG